MTKQVELPRLPKQFKYWMRKMGIYQDYRSSRYIIARGRGRHWRVTADDVFECSDKFADFDRWANSNPNVGVCVSFLTSEKAFKAIVGRMLAEANTQSQAKGESDLRDKK